MADIIDEETKKAWEELVSKKKEEKKKEVEEKGKEEEKKLVEEKAAEWLTGGLEEEVTMPSKAPVLETTPVLIESLEDFASTIPKKEEEKKEEIRYNARVYETQGIYEKEEAYEETPENLFGRLVRPLDVNELRQDFPRVRMPSESEVMLRMPEREEIIKYVEKKLEGIESQAPSFLKRERFEKKYKR